MFTSTTRVQRRLTRLGALVLGLTVLVACEPPPGTSVSPASTREGGDWFDALAAAEVVDLSHAYDVDTVFWPTSEPFRLTVDADGDTPAGYYYAANSFCTAEHGGTHLDAPVHFARGRHTVDQVPLERLAGPAVVVDVSRQARARPVPMPTTR